jgi:molybdenum cofactor cytidylyltransferase
MLAQESFQPGCAQLGAADGFRQARTSAGSQSNGSPTRGPNGMMNSVDAVFTFSLGVVILGAGKSSRMGRPKLLLPWGNTTVLGRLLAQWTALNVSQITIVCATQDQAIGVELDRLEFPVGDRIINPDPASGMFSSVQCASKWQGWKRDLTHWAVVLGDQPHLQTETLKNLLLFAQRHPVKICQPAQNGHARHPVVMPRDVFLALDDARHATLKEFLTKRADRVELAEMEDPGLELDLDRPEDYERALKLFFKH